MDKFVGMDPSIGQSKTVLSIFGSNGLEAIYEANNNSNFDIVQPNTGKITDALCKRRACGKNELQRKPA